MKKLLKTLLCLMFVIGGINIASAQMTKEQIKDVKERRKAERDLVNEKVSKDAKKQAKEMSKEGWKVFPGSLSLEKQIDRQQRLNDINSETQQFFIVTNNSVSSSIDAAKMMCEELAKQSLASKIQEDITSAVETNAKIEEVSENEAQGVITIIKKSKSLISQTIGRTITVCEFYRTLPNGKKEVSITLAYSVEQAMLNCKQIVKEELSKSDDNSISKVGDDDLDKLFEQHAKDIDK